MVGAGIAGVSCARTLVASGLDVRVVDRGHRIGGRMAVRTVHGRPVDLGAAYFTVRGDDFAAEVATWRSAGLVRRWTDTFHVATPEGLQGTTTGPARYAAPRGLRSVVEWLASDLVVDHPTDVELVATGPTVDGERAEAVVLAMPDPQAADLLGEDLVALRTVLEDGLWDPALALVAAWEERCWPELDAAFVNDSPVLSFVADDGRRRGDGAPVLVAHSTGLLAARHLDDPDGGGPAMLAELRAVLGIPEPPAWTMVKRWGLARPHRGREAAYHLDGSMIGVCGDGWLGPPRIEAAWTSGRLLAKALLEAL